MSAGAGGRAAFVSAVRALTGVLADAFGAIGAGAVESGGRAAGASPTARGHHGGARTEGAGAGCTAGRGNDDQAERDNDGNND